jgi:polar amino acid transport system ATP-binding protein
MSVISARHVKKSFGKIEVLKDVSMEVKKGEVVVLMGPSGTGKSTFLRTLNYLEVPDGGEIYFDGIKLENNPSVLREARSKMAFVSQSYNLFPHMNVLKNVTYPLVKIKKMEKDEAREIAVKTLKRVGLADKLKSYPGQLSGGQKQRVAIARAIAIRPDLILFDEPTSALDPEMTSEVLNVMKELADDGITMIVVTHEITFAKYAADRIVFMADGIIVEENLPEVFFKKPSTPQALKFLAKLA